MDLALIALALLALIIGLGIFVLNRQIKGDEKKPQQEREDQLNEQQNSNRNQVAQTRLRNRLRVRNTVANSEGDGAQASDLNDSRAFPTNSNRNQASNEDEELEESEEWASHESLKKKIGTKKLAKMEAKAEKKAMNEQLARDREERKEREKELDEIRRKKDEEEARLERERDEEEKRKREEQEKKEYEEYLRLKESFQIEEEGFENTHDELSSQNLLQKFVDFIKQSKVVILEELAVEFKLKTQDVINRIQQVQEMGMLTGVMDDRGKFIYITEDELQKVCTFIKQRGRVSISELAQSSNELINMKSELTQIDVVE